MNRLFLIVSLAGERIAFPAAEVEAVIEIEDVIPAPGAPAHVTGLSALRSRVLTVIDCAAAMGLPGRDQARGAAVVAVLDGHPYALLVDEVEDVVEAEGEPAPLSPQTDPRWAAIGRGTIEVEGRLMLLAGASAFVAGPAAAAA